MLHETDMRMGDLRRQLSILARGSRVSLIPENALLNLPQSEKGDEVLFEGNTMRRKRIVLLTKGCSVATCTMCSLPAEAIAFGREISDDDIISQFDASFQDSPISNFDMVTVYTNGNWFVDSELSPNVRDQIYKKVRGSSASVLTVESLPQFITAGKLSQAKDGLGDKKLAVAIGLQSSNDIVRQLAINSTCTKGTFEKGIALLKEYGYIPQVFLMIKPPFLTEKEGIEDTVESIKYLSELGIRTPVLCLTRIASNTVLSKLYQSGEYKPPWVWSVIEVLRRSQLVSPDSIPRVVTSELKTEANPNSIPAQNCGACTLDIVRKIDRFNVSRDFKELNSAACACKSDYLQEMALEEATSVRTLPERVRFFLEQQANNSRHQTEALVVFSR